MKNIYLLPTNKPSRLVFDTVDKKLYYSDMLFQKTANVLPQHLYITSGEEIKDENWYIDDKQNIAKADKNFIFNCSHEFTKFWSKIILTNDLQLIKDGVQAIDDDFLEWFVKNPSCEEVEVKYCPFSNNLSTISDNVQEEDIIDYSQSLARSLYNPEAHRNESIKGLLATACQSGYAKSQETHPFSEKDMIKFAEWLDDERYFQTKKGFFKSFNDRKGKSTKKLLQLWKKQCTQKKKC